MDDPDQDLKLYLSVSLSFIDVLVCAIVSAAYRVEGQFKIAPIIIGGIGMGFLFLTYFIGSVICLCFGAANARFVLSALQVPGFLTAKQNKRSRAARRCVNISAVAVLTLILLLPCALLPALMFGVPKTHMVAKYNEWFFLESGEQALFKPNLSDKAQISIRTLLWHGKSCDLHIYTVSHVPPKVWKEKIINFTNLGIGDFQTYAQLQTNGSLFVDFQADDAVNAWLYNCSSGQAVDDCEGKEGTLQAIGEDGGFNVVFHNNDTSKLVRLNLTLKEEVWKFEVDTCMVANKSINVSGATKVVFNARNAVLFQLGSEEDGHNEAYVEIDQGTVYFMGTHEDSIVTVACLSCFVAFVCVAGFATFFIAFQNDEKEENLSKAQLDRLPVCGLLIDRSTNFTICAIFVRAVALLAVVAACTTGIVVYRNRRTKLFEDGDLDTGVEEEAKQLNIKIAVFGVLMGLAAALLVLVQIWCSCSVPVEDNEDDSEDEQRQGEEEPLMKTPSRTPTDMKSPAEEETATPAGTGTDSLAPPAYTP